MIKFARQLRHQQTEVEQKLWFHLRNREFLNHKFRRQHPIGSYIVDFCCIEKRLIVELDGSQHLAQQTKDAGRTHYLQSQGYRVIRFWDNEIFNQLDGVLETIRLTLDPHPNPLPRRERE